MTVFSYYKLSKNFHCLSGGTASSIRKPSKFPPEFGNFVKNKLQFLAKRSSLDLFDYFLCQDKK